MMTIQDKAFSGLIDEFRIDIPKRMRKEHLPGLSIAFVNADGILWEAGFGVTDKDRRQPVTARTTFSLQSCSKTFTTTAIMLAVQDGLLNLDLPIREHLPGFRLQSRFDPHPEEKITLRLLLSHKAGFTHEAPAGNNYVYATNKSTFEEHIESIQATWLRFSVGQRYSYSNLGIDLAGYILQQASGMPFAEYMKKKLFEPLGMERSSFDFKAIAADEDRAIGHDIVYETISLPVPLIVPMIPSGGIYTSAADTARFIRFHLNGGKIENRNILDQKYLEEMYTIPLPVNGQADGYALGIAVNHHHRTRRYTHSGGGFGFLSDMLWYPDLGVGIALLTNSVNQHLQWWYANHLLDKVLELPEYKEKTSQVSSTNYIFKVPAPITKRGESLRYLIGHYVSRIPDQCHIKSAPAGLNIRFEGEKETKPLVFFTEENAYVLDQNKKIADNPPACYQFILKDGEKPSHIISTQDGNFYDYNEGPNDPPGVLKPGWYSYLGDYCAKGSTIPQWVKVFHYAGNLYLKLLGCKLRLEEHQPGLFFTSTGEAIDFRSQDPIFFGVIVQKIGFITKFRKGLILSRAFVRGIKNRFT